MTESAKTNQFLRLLMEHQRQLYAFIRGLVPDRHDADDVFQETILTMWSKFDEFDPQTNFTAWGITTARFTILGRRKRFARQNRQFSQAVQTLLQQQTDQVFGQLDRRLQALQSCLQKLTDRDAELIRLRYEQEVAIKTIADRAGRSQQSIYKRMARIHAVLLRCIRQTLQREEYA